jgi:hypothetical protein
MTFVNGLRSHPLYGSWRMMMQRCHNSKNKSYKNYGGRGIGVCSEWHDVAVYIAWIEERLGPRPEGQSLDRINNDGNYEPGNVHWATALQQEQNKRAVKRLRKGETHGMAKLTDAAVTDIRKRVAAGASKASVARDHHVSDVLVGKVVRRQIWAHVNG